MIKLDNEDLKVMKEVGERTLTYYTTEKDGYLTTKDNLIGCIQDLLSEIERLEEELEDKEYFEDYDE